MEPGISINIFQMLFTQKHRLSHWYLYVRSCKQKRSAYLFFTLGMSSLWPLHGMLLKNSWGVEPWGNFWQGSAHGGECEC